MSGEARLEILSRIYRAGAHRERAEADCTVPAGLPTLSPTQTVEQFAEYAAEYRAQVRGCTEAELPQIIAELLGGERAILPPGLPAAWIEGEQHALDTGQTHRELSDVGAVITGCAVAIAETGTVVLDHGAGQGRRALTLVPDHHVCVVFESQVVQSMSQAMSALASSVRAGQPLTFISGPSATSDIELSRVEGVHGPRRLDIVLVVGAPS